MDTVLDYSILSRLLVVVGGFTVMYYLLTFTWKFWCGFRVYVLSEYWHTCLATYGKWAVITGATSGIGKAYAIELARRGLDIVLISRSKEKLCTVAKEIESLHGRQTCIIQADFTEGSGIYPAIAERLKGLEIGILVNNVGMNYAGMLVNFLDVPNPEKRITEVINCNILSVTQMTQIVLPLMIQRGRGLIINISSEAATEPQPMLTVYSASKIFVTYFSRCLNSEYTSKGINVQCVAPFIVSTNMTHNVGVSWLVKSAPAFAREALNTVGHSSFTSGCISHALQHLALSIFFPGWLRLSPFFMRQMEKFAQTQQPKIEALMSVSQRKQKQS